MALRPLGRTGIEVGPVGLGTVKLGRNRAVKYPRPFDLPDDRQVDRLLARARELGVNLLDTAPAYGESEERLGRALGRRRGEWVIASKAGEDFEDGCSRFDFSAAAVRASVERSLRRLGTDRLDVLLLHSDGGEQSFARFLPALEMLESLRAAGLVRATGFSGKTVAGGLQAVDLVDVVMVTTHPGYEAERPVIQAAHRQGRGVLVKKALASGHLAEGGAPALDAAMAHAFAEPGVTSVVVGTLDPDHLAADVAAAERAIAGLRPAGG